MAIDVGIDRFSLQGLVRYRELAGVGQSFAIPTNELLTSLIKAKEEMRRK
ncbi:MAG: hypothetical protein QME64_02000 [bacterium]|nr:hypothetical protein [bacterium]